MKIKLISIILTFILSLSTASLLSACNDKDGNENTSGSESENGTREEETFAPPIDVADADDICFVLSSDESSYAVYGIFNESGAKKVVIPSEYLGLPVTAIGEEAFYSSEPLETIVIPDTVTHIGSYAFDGCANLKAVEMSSNLVYIGDGAFEGCDSLELTKYDNALYLGSADSPYTILMRAADYGLESCNVHENTKIIYDYAFYECYDVNEITIPNGIRHVGSYAFDECYDLFPTYSDYENVYYLGNDENPYLVLVSPKVKRDITSITIHENTEIIAPGAFLGCESLTSITLPDNIRVIGQYAFEGCAKLTSVTLPKSQWRVVNGESVSVLLFINTEDSDVANRLVEVYYYCTWQKK